MKKIISIILVCTLLCGCANKALDARLSEIDSHVTTGMIDKETGQHLKDYANEHPPEDETPIWDTYGKPIVITLLIGGVITAIVLLAISGGNTSAIEIPKYNEYPCDCPGDRDSLGRTCGERSAYSKSGGRTPICTGRT